MAWYSTVADSFCTRSMIRRPTR